MIKLQKILLILGAIPTEPSRKRNVITWKHKLTSSRKTKNKNLREMYKDINQLTPWKPEV